METPYTTYGFRASEIILRLTGCSHGTVVEAVDRHNRFRHRSRPQLRRQSRRQLPRVNRRQTCDRSCRRSLRPLPRVNTLLCRLCPTVVCYNGSCGKRRAKLAVQNCFCCHCTKREDYSSGNCGSHTLLAAAGEHYSL